MVILTYATLEDLSELLAIEQASFEHPWSKESLAGELSDPLSSIIIVKSSNNSYLCGYICYKIIPPEAELLRIAVRSECRRQGVAQALLDEMFRFLRLRKVVTGGNRLS